MPSCSRTPMARLSKLHFRLGVEPPRVESLQSAFVWNSQSESLSQAIERDMWGSGVPRAAEIVFWASEGRLVRPAAAGKTELLGGVARVGSRVIGRAVTMRNASKENLIGTR